MSERHHNSDDWVRPFDIVPSDLCRWIILERQCQRPRSVLAVSATHVFFRCEIDELHGLSRKQANAIDRLELGCALCRAAS